MPAAILPVAIAMWALVAHAQPAPGAGGDVSARPATGLPSGKVRTGKERLGDKWSDEQRLDNCKVPLDKRGAKPRPDTCAQALTQ